MTEYDIYPVPDLATHPPAALKEHMKHCMSLHLRLKQDFVKALDIFFFLSPLRERLLSPKMLSQPLNLLCFLLSILYSPPSSPSYPTLASLALPSPQHRAVNLRQWQTPTSKSAILIPLCISIMEQLDMRALLSGALLAHCVLHPIRQ